MQCVFYLMSTLNDSVESFSWPPKKMFFFCSSFLLQISVHWSNLLDLLDCGYFHSFHLINFNIKVFITRIILFNKQSTITLLYFFIFQFYIILGFFLPCFFLIMKMFLIPRQTTIYLTSILIFLNFKFFCSLFDSLSRINFKLKADD